MCFHSKQSAEAKKLEKRYNARFKNDPEYLPSLYNGFAHPNTPVIINKDVHTIEMYQWGLIPFWAKDTSIQKQTLNAKIETIAEKASFKNSLNNRCLILVDGFYEWKWLDEKGKVKEKYLITFPDNDPFSFAGLYNSWTDKNSGEIVDTYTILTTEANELMAEIHNNKKRMPVILRPEDEAAWLQGANHQIFAVPEIELVATLAS